MAKYDLVQTTQGGSIISISVVDMEIWPKDMTKFMANQADWYRREMIDSFKLVTFPIHARQAEAEATKRARTYADYLNREADAIEIATKLVTI